MGKQSINEIKVLLQEDKLSDAEIMLLQSDTRKGVQQLIKTYEKRKRNEAALVQAYEEMCTYERKCYQVGKKLVAGIDEAGRGPLAGPVVAAAVILPVDFKLLGLNDSKQLNEAKREEYFEVIREKAISYGISIIDSQTIDQINILEATKLAMKNALLQLNPYPQHVLIDAVKLDDLPYSSEAIIKGDAKSISIAAASVLAKVTRDRLMKEIHNEFPMYDFRSNMGYGTREHMVNLVQYGPSPYHRKSFAPVKENIK
ncbi:ribonuclease HII [Ornithinibacillus sp. BX22]|uniref:Ribonuclease HII n=2 Tax=Ornithinibacillus TaxID=484508 RepID=A0A923RGC1_9BACI|nr:MULTISPECIES: ribonuclease HII [Ornithinibacillus]MBC5635944.1 ribonuclease HII [Ornithinibacillus hominis]MBS3680067.1 ribonuclease HII [Ornithinibacillus massiliensis]